MQKSTNDKSTLQKSLHSREKSTTFEIDIRPGPRAVQLEREFQVPALNPTPSI